MWILLEPNKLATRQIILVGLFGAYYNHVHNILRMLEVLPNFSFTISETMPEY